MGVFVTSDQSGALSQGRAAFCKGEVNEHVLSSLCAAVVKISPLGGVCSDMQADPAACH